MSTQMIIRLDSDLKIKLNRLARSEGKTTSQVVRELIEGYIQDRDISGYIDDLWARVGRQLQQQKVQSTDIEQAITEVRSARRARGH